jgi:hypothetical protein
VRSHHGPSWAVEYAERQLERRIVQERKLNEVIERRNPHFKPTAQYARGPRPENTFYTRQQFLSYLVKFTMSKYDPNVRV